MPVVGLGHIFPYEGQPSLSLVSYQVQSSPYLDLKQCISYITKYKIYHQNTNIELTHQSSLLYHNNPKLLGQEQVQA